MPKNFYNLPDAWNPGYAIPDSVMDEGLERRAFVTAMTPRGTYDDPTIGNAGYAVPQYIDDEGYGQGTLTTKWLPRGYYGPHIPHYLDQQFSKIVGDAPASGGGVVLKMETLGDDAAGYTTRPVGTNRFEQFGKRSAAALMLSMDKLPVAQRPAALRKALDQMDPRLYQRTVTYADRLSRMGARPRVALAHGLAAGITEGMLRELRRMGQSKSAPQARTLPGLGCYGCESLGATVVAMNKVPSAILGVTATSTPATGGQCPPGQTGYNWVEASGSAAAHWERARTGQAQFCGSTVPSGPPGGVQVYDTNVLVIGPGVELPLNAARGSQLVFDAPSYVATHPDLASWIKTAWTTGDGLAVVPWASSPSVLPWLQAVGIAPTDKINVARVTRFIAAAPYKFTHPSDGKTWGVWVGLTNLTPLGAVKDASQPVSLMIWTQVPPTQSFLSKALSITSKIAKPAAVYGGGVIAGALSTVSELACNLVTSPGAAAAAAGASGGAAAVGVSIAAGLCSPSPTAPPPPAVESSSDLTIPIAIGAGAIGLALLLKHKKKA